MGDILGQFRNNLEKIYGQLLRQNGQEVLVVTLMAQKNKTFILFYA